MDDLYKQLKEMTTSYSSLRLENQQVYLTLNTWKTEYLALTER
jgi:hypothetical protein